MDTGTAFLSLALCFAADELSTRALIRVGGRETMIQRPAVRIAIKVPVGVLFAKKQKHSKALAIGAPLLYCGAGVWNWTQAQEQLRRNGKAGQ